MNREGAKSAKKEQHFLLSPLGGGQGGVFLRVLRAFAV